MSGTSGGLFLPDFSIAFNTGLKGGLCNLPLGWIKTCYWHWRSELATESIHNAIPEFKQLFKNGSSSTMKRGTCWSGGIAPRILNLGTIIKWVVIFVLSFILGVMVNRKVSTISGNRIPPSSCFKTPTFHKEINSVYINLVLWMLDTKCHLHLLDKNVSKMFLRNW
jgi:hypothetical protein